MISFRSRVTPPDRRGARALQLTIGLLVSAALIYWAFHDKDWAKVWASVRNMHVLPMLIAVGVSTLPFPLRIPRWRLLLRHDDDTPLPTPALWHAIAIGFAANNTLPFRAGELLRVAAVSRLGEVSFPSALSSLAVERVLDALIVIGMLGIGLVLAHFPPDVTISGAPIGAAAGRIGAICLIAFLGAIFAAWKRDWALGVVRRVVGHGAIGEKIHHFVGRLLAGLNALRDPRRALPVVAWTVVIWLVNAAAFAIALTAFDLSVPFSGVLVLQGLLMIGIAAPQGPGYPGGFEVPIVLVLGFYAIDKDIALAYALTYHLLTFVPITLLGVWSAVRSGVTLKAARAVERDAS
ncbi:MAG: lysylphosphatidylglycerol synthase transmembrane domain-containing protein [Gemmatimonadota bacterium]